MHIKTYRGTSVVELLEQAREELGPLAVMLSLRKVTVVNENGMDEEVLEGSLGVDPETPRDVRPAPRTVMVNPVADTYTPASNSTQSTRRFRPVLDDEDLHEVRSIPAHLRELPKLRIPSYARPNSSTPSETAKPAKQKVILLVGPHRSGKTTMAAKIAAHLRKQTQHAITGAGGAVGLIGLDPANTVGSALLMHLARQIEQPLAQAASAHELLNLIERWQNRGPLVLDTPSLDGKKSERGRRIAEAMNDKNLDAQMHLVLRGDEAPSAVAKHLQDFGPSGYRKVVFTHLDLAGRSMEVLMELMKGRAEVVFLGTGRNVPGDLVVPETRAMATVSR